MQKTQKLKTKVRFTSLDVAAMVSNLQMLIGMRATNIYDLNPSTYLIKLAKSQQKHYLLIQNGVRFHTANQKPDKKTIPTGFTMKFRKFLRSKRLQSIIQVGVERVVVFTFGSQSFTNHLIIELYSQGNIILTDNNYRILQCIRSHEFNQRVKTAVGEIYPFEYAANIYLENIDVSQNKIQQILEKEKQEKNNHDNEVKQENDNKKKKEKKSNKKGAMKLKDIVFKLIPCLFPLVIEHILLSHEKNPEQKVSKQNKQIILQGAKICYKFLKDYLNSSHRGYLFEKEDKGPVKQGQTKEKQYFQFCSYKNIKYIQQKCTQFATFNEAVEEYFIHYKKTQHQQEQQFQQIAWKKYDQIKKDQDERVKKLQQQQDIYKLKAEYIEKNIHDIDAIIKIIKTMQDNGYSWDDIGRMIAESKKNGDPLANMIHQLNILKRQITILLGDPIDEEQMFELLPVEINIDYNAYTNATMYYESKKRNYQKQQRTKQASEQVLKLAEKDALKKIQKKKNQVLAKNMPQRKVFWFEKFNWFISSQGYLIISGRDSHQNELVVKRYMKAGDLYMHSDYGGAASTVIKKNRKDIPVPHATLQQAAIFTVCRSKAWDTKILSGAWWVYHDQVSKSAPTGEFLPTGSFMIRGKRNFIQPNRMQMGMTLLFKVDNESAQRHMNDRRIHEEEMKKQQEEMKKPLMSGQDTKEEDEEFAIVSIDTQTRKQRAEEMKKQKKQMNLKKQDSKVQNGKDQGKNNQQTTKKSDNSDSADGSGESEQQTLQAPKKLSKKPSQTNKNVKVQKKDVKKQKQQPLQPQQKHKQRNKKKLKKLQKYLQEQDEDQRQIIMKMLGAKQMKHMKEIKQVEVEQEQKKVSDNKKKKKDKKGTKKGIGKYIDMQSDEEQMKEKLNPDKVLFLKDKKKQEEEEKKLMENSSDSDEEKQENQQANEKGQGQLVDNNEEPEQKSQQEQQQADVDADKQEEAKQQVKPEEDQQVDQKVLDSELGELYKLVGRPHPEDKFDCLVAMCAPYNSIKQNKFKIKLVPGGLKKGKAARGIMNYFLSGEMSEEDKILLKSIPEQELINAVIGNVKLAGAGLLKIEMKQKQDKKQKRKQEDIKKKEQVE